MCINVKSNVDSDETKMMNIGNRSIVSNNITKQKLPETSIKLIHKHFSKLKKAGAKLDVALFIF